MKRAASLTVMFGVEVLLIEAVGIPFSLNFDMWAFMDAGGNLTAPFLLQQGYRPVIDFGYIYGLLPLLVDRLWLDLAGATPVICTNVASMPEIVENGVSGFVVPPNDPAALRERICWLRDHPVEAAAMGREGRRRVLDKFTWSQVVQRCLEICRS